MTPFDWLRALVRLYRVPPGKHIEMSLSAERVPGLIGDWGEPPASYIVVRRLDWYHFERATGETPTLDEAIKASSEIVKMWSKEHDDDQSTRVHGSINGGAA